jgi:hypothetical protein
VPQGRSEGIAEAELLQAAHKIIEGQKTPGSSNIELVQALRQLLLQGKPSIQKLEVAKAPAKKQPPKAAAAAAPLPKVPKAEDKRVEWYKHLYKPEPATILTAKNVHEAVEVLGLDMKIYKICGSSARLVATLQAFKKANILCPKVLKIYSLY